MSGVIGVKMVARCLRASDEKELEDARDWDRALRNIENPTEVLGGDIQAGDLFLDPGCADHFASKRERAELEW
jgi:hypothetical protein